MHLLIIGNGFDKAHELPTKYTELLSICRLIKRAEVAFLGSEIFVRPKYRVGDLEDEEISKVKEFACSLGANAYVEFDKIIHKNFWIKYFLRHKNSKDSWFDFEEEIKNVLYKIYNIEPDSSKEIRGIKFDSIIDECIENDKRNIGTIGKLYEYLFDEHKELIYLIELYMGKYISKLKIQGKSLFKNIDFKLVLSFNYTDTYRKLYNQSSYVCFIHGFAEEDVSKNN